MANYFGLCPDSGRNALNHALVYSEDENQENIPTLKQKRRQHRRKPSKARAMDIRRRMAVSTSVESEDQTHADGEDDGAIGDSEESDDGENVVFAPSGAVKRSSRMKLKSKRRSLIGQTRQAGLQSPMASAKVKKPRSILAHSRTRSSEKVRFNLENLTSYADDLSHNTNAEEPIEDVDLSSGSDDDVYETLNFISDSDEDDEKIEELESEILIKHLEETGEIKEIDQVLPWSDAFREEIDRTALENIEKPALTPQNFGVDFFSQSNDPFLAEDPNDVVSSIEFDPCSFPNLQNYSVPASEFETGLQTPSSISMAPKKFDDEETEEEEPSQRRLVKNARLSKKDKDIAVNRVRKHSKPKTPKRGSWNIPKGTTIIRHDDDNKIVMTQFGKVTESGTLTPKGLVKRDSIPSTPILGIPMAAEYFSAFTAPSSAQTSPIVGPNESLFFSDGINHFNSPIAHASSLTLQSLQEFVQDDQT